MNMTSLLKTVQTAAMLLAAATLFGLAAPALADYQRKAEEATDYIQSHFYDAAAKRYRPSFPVNPKALPFDFMWANGVQYSAVVAAARWNPAKYRKLLYDFSDGMESGYWDPQAPVPGFNAYCSGPGGTDKYYDDNAWLAISFAEAYKNTKDPIFLKRALETQKFVLSGWDETLGGGIFWKLDHQSKNTCSNAPAAAAALHLAQVAGDKDQLAWALKIRRWLGGKLQNKDGLYWDCVTKQGKLEKTKWSYNTAMMIQADLLLYKLKHQASDLREARRMADAGLAFWTDPGTGSLQKTENTPRFTIYLSEALLRLYDETNDEKYLDAVRRQADHGYRFARDPKDGGYWDNWKDGSHRPGEAKSLIESAAAARLFWLLVPYSDPNP